MAQKSGDAVPVMDSTETNMTDKTGKKTAAANWQRARQRTYNRTAVLCTTRGQPARSPWTTATHAVDDPRRNVDKPLPHVDEPWATQRAHENHMLRSLHHTNHYILCF